MTQDQQLATLLGAMAGTMFVVALAVHVLLAIALWKVFAKAGERPWLALIPIVNLFYIVKIAGFPAWYALGFFVPIVNVVLNIFVALRLGRAFGKDTLFSIVALWLFSIVGYFILGFGSAQYGDPVPGEESPAAPAGGYGGV